VTIAVLFRKGRSRTPSRLTEPVKRQLDVNDVHRCCDFAESIAEIVSWTGSWSIALTLDETV